MALAMLPAELAEVTDPLQDEDELLVAGELGELSHAHRRIAFVATSSPERLNQRARFGPQE